MIHYIKKFDLTGLMEQEIYNFFGSSEEYKIYWKNKEEIQFLHPVQKIESQISENRALILLFQNQKG